MRFPIAAAAVLLAFTAPSLARAAPAPVKPAPAAATRAEAKPDFAERKDLAGRYLEALGIVETMRVMMISMMGSDSMAADSHLSAAEQAKVNAIVIEALDSVMPQYIDKITDVYAETYTVEELRALVDFYTSPMGRSLVVKQRQVANRGKELIDWFTPVLMAEVMRLVHERYPDAPGSQSQS